MGVSPGNPGSENTGEPVEGAGAPARSLVERVCRWAPLTLLLLAGLAQNPVIEVQGYGSAEPLAHTISSDDVS